MKLLHILTIFTILSCNSRKKQGDKTPLADSGNVHTQITKTDNSKYYARQDIIMIAMEMDDTLKYAKADFNEIVDKHPEFFNTYTENPDQAYYNGNNNKEFGSEVGQDNYYQLYAYFLKQKNGIDNYKQERKKLINIYSNINSLFGHLQYGGTYFAHQSRRILGYAEHSIYLLSKKKEVVEKTYDISKQKELYIKSLRQLIEDESKIDFNTLGKDKIARNKELNNIVDELNKSITDNFYLRRTQEFQYRHYEYY